MSDSDLDQLYRGASAGDPARPGDAAREAILNHARQLAAERQAKGDTPWRGSHWRALLQGVRWQIAAPVAAAVLAGILLAPQWRADLLPASRPSAAGRTAGAILQQSAPAPAAVPQSAPVPPPAPAPQAPPLLPAPHAAAARSALESADVSSNTTQPSAQRQGEDLRQAASRGDLEQARALLRTQTTRINARDRNGRTALMLAVMHGQTPLVRELLSHGADPNIADAFGRTPLAIARGQNQRPLIDALLAAGAR